MRPRHLALGTEEPGLLTHSVASSRQSHWDWHYTIKYAHVLYDKILASVARIDLFLLRLARRLPRLAIARIGSSGTCAGAGLDIGHVGGGASVVAIAAAAAAQIIHPNYNAALPIATTHFRLACRLVFDYSPPVDTQVRNRQYNIGRVVVSLNHLPIAF